MKILIDTHIFLWFVNNNPQLSPTAKHLLESDVDILLSIASLWEIAVKVSIGKLTLPGPIQEFIPQQLRLNQIELLRVEIQHLHILSTLPFHHRDPFDRLIIAQSLAEDIQILSVDTIFDEYGVNRIK